jgi:uncharacterized protein YhbP (UPF0306 family)
LYLITDPATKHAKNIELNSSIAATVFDSHLGFWTEMRGLQLFGTCYKTSFNHLPNALKCFINRFPVFTELVKKPADMLKKSVIVKFYTIEVKRIKLFDEPNFGEEVFINLEI